MHDVKLVEIISCWWLFSLKIFVLIFLVGWYLYIMKSFYLH